MNAIASSLPINGLAAHAVCAAAGVRDGFRAAQYYARDLSNADNYANDEVQKAPFLSRFVGQMARLTDQLLSWGADLSIRLLLPSWRQLPSPFAPGFIGQVSEGIRKDSLVNNPLFNAYFFRAAKHIIARYTHGPYLVLEHRVDAARRGLATDEVMTTSETTLLARILIELAGQGAIARAGRAKDKYRFFERVDPNIAVNAVACIALLFAEEGRPVSNMNEDEFFEVTGALIGPRLERIAELVSRKDATALANELSDIKSFY